MPRLTAKEWLLIGGVASCFVVWYMVGEALRAIM